MAHLILDAMGGDNAPACVVDAAVMAVKEDPELVISLVGAPEVLKQQIVKSGGAGLSALKIVPASEIVTNEEDAVAAVKAKQDASIVVGVKMLKAGKGDALISAGSTGALITASSLYVKRMKGVKRAALAPVLPADTGCFMLLDAGANSDCKPEYYAQFATMGSIYMKLIHGVENPRVGLVNIGTEEGKGTPVINEAYDLLKTMPVNFVGNIEARDLPMGTVDVAVCDGFVGNVILKFYEGVGSVFNRNLKDIFFASLKTKLAALLVKKQVLTFQKKFDYKEYGGGILLGVDGLVMKSHGSSDKRAYYNTIRQTKRAVESGMLGEIREMILSTEGVGKIQ